MVKKSTTRTNLDLFKIGTRTNILKVGGASLQHEMTKAILFTKLILGGATVVCNGKLLNGEIPDLVMIDTKTPICYEICHSEKLARTMKKDYPGKIVIIKALPKGLCVDLISRINRNIEYIT